MTKFIRDHTEKKSEIVSKQSIYRKKIRKFEIEFCAKNKWIIVIRIWNFTPKLWKFIDFQLILIL